MEGNSDGVGNVGRGRSVGIAATGAEMGATVAATGAGASVAIGAAMGASVSATCGCSGGTTNGGNVGVAATDGTSVSLVSSSHLLPVVFSIACTSSREWGESISGGNVVSLKLSRIRSFKMVRVTKLHDMAAMNEKVMAATAVPTRNKPPTRAHVSVDLSKAWRGSAAAREGGAS